MRKIKQLLKDRSGTATFIEMAVLVIVCMMLLTMSISYLQIYSKHNLVNSMAHEIARFVEIEGEVSPDVYAEFERLKLATGFSNATVDLDKSGRIPLEERFTVTVSVQQKFGIGSIKVIPVTVKAIATGRSEVYWK